jgi:hypothetical protein
MWRFISDSDLGRAGWRRSLTLLSHALRSQAFLGQALFG